MEAASPSAAVARPADHTGESGGRAVLADLPLAGQSRDGNLNTDDGRDLFPDEIGGRIGNVPGRGPGRLVTVDEAPEKKCD